MDGIRHRPHLIRVIRNTGKTVVNALQFAKFASRLPPAAREHFPVWYCSPSAIVELNPLRPSATFALAMPPPMLLALLPNYTRQALCCDLLNALVFTLALGLGVSSHAAANPDDPFVRAIDQRMPALLHKYRVPGAVVSCITNGEVAWTKAFGRANLATGAPMQPDMIFNHGSNGKVLTMWGIMRLVEQGKVELDAPANRYLKRWQLRSSQFDPEGVTIRRLLCHRAGLTVHGFLDYDQRRRLPTLAEMLEGKNQIQLFGEVNGPVFIKWQPGSTNVYSGGGFVLLQMIIEDVSGESFAAFMHREVTAPLGIGGLSWVWTRQLESAAPMTYGELQE